MPFVLSKHKPTNINQPIQIVLLKNNINLSLKQSQALLSKNRVFQSNINIDNIFIKIIFYVFNFLCFNKLDFKEVLKNGDKISKKYIYLAVFKPKSRGLKPIFVCDDFVVFDKPNKVLTYPISKNISYSMLDELRAFCGDGANFVHRLDYETSGLLVGATNKKSEIALKQIWQNRGVVKKYLALIDGHLKTGKNELIIDTNIAPQSKDAFIGVKMRADFKKSMPHTKTALSIVKVLEYFKPNSIITSPTTLVEVDIKTGRQHQIRLHLSSIGHAIIGDPLYLADDLIVDKHLKKHFSHKDRVKYFKHNKMMLHCHYLNFTYNNMHFFICSKRSLMPF